MVSSKSADKIKHSGKFWLIIGVFVLIDYITKHIVRLTSPDFYVLPFLKITYIQNTGVAFGLFKGRNMIFAVIGILFVLGILYYIYRSKEFRELSSGLVSKSRKSPSNKDCTYLLYIISLGLICAGAIGNVIDRLFFGYVTDFIYFTFFPAFNIADSCITVGAAIFIYASIRIEYVRNIKAK